MTVPSNAMGVSYDLAAPLPGLAGRGLLDDAPIRVEVVGRAAVDAAWSGPSGPPLWQTVFADGAPYSMERGVGGDHRFVYADRDLFHVDASLRRLRCAPGDPSDHIWKRILLDDVFYALSALRGCALLHCSAVAGPDGVAAICSATGGGKTTLAIELLKRGWSLVCDDLLALKSKDGAPLAYPGPAVMNVARAALNSGGEAVGDVLGPLPGEDEVWIEVSRAVSTPMPLDAICVLSRVPGGDVAVEARSASVVDLLPYAIGLPMAPELQAEKFQTLSDVAQGVHLQTVQVPAEMPPAEEADVIEAALTRCGSGAGAGGP